jgi:hypothetical protein
MHALRLGLPGVKPSAAPSGSYAELSALGSSWQQLKGKALPESGHATRHSQFSSIPSRMAALRGHLVNSIREVLKPTSE